jgi:type VI secretion system secreted protein Hcp
MANEFYVTIDGIRTGRFHGESTNKAHKEKITGLEFFFEVTSPRDAASGQATGKRQYKPITIVKDWGTASPQLFNALITNETLTSVLLEFPQTGPDGKEQTLQTIKLTGATISAFRQYIGDAGNFAFDPTPGSRRLENVTFSFRTIEITNITGQTTATDDPFSAT